MPEDTIKNDPFFTQRKTDELVHYLEHHRDPMVEGVKKLLLEGADINVQETDTKNTPLLAALLIGDEDIAEYLLSLEPDLDMQNTLGLDALKSAVLYNSRLAQKILDITPKHNQYYKHSNDSSCTALLTAIAQNPDMVEPLLKAGANPNLGDHNKKPPLAYAFESYSPSNAPELLIQYGADVNAKFEDDVLSVLMKAIQKKSPYVELLLNSGADLHFENTLGRNAFFIACSCHPKILPLLLTRGCKVSNSFKIQPKPHHSKELKANIAEATEIVDAWVERQLIEQETTKVKSHKVRCL